MTENKYDVAVLALADPGDEVFELTFAGECNGFWWNLIDLITLGAFQAGALAKDIAKRFYLVQNAVTSQLVAVDRDLTAEISGSVTLGRGRKLVTHDGRVFRIVRRVR